MDSHVYRMPTNRITGGRSTAYDRKMQDRIAKKYPELRGTGEKKTLAEICRPREFELQRPQKFLREFMSPDSDHTGILVYHEPGAGKTCTAISIAEGYIGIQRPVVILPAFLRDNFRDELRTQCAGNAYIRETEKNKLAKLDYDSPERERIIARTNERIDANYDIYSYNKAVALLQKGELDLSNKLLIIDEVHNMISETGTYYNSLQNAINGADPKPRIVLLSATPIFDRPAEFAQTMNLLLPDDQQMPSEGEFYEQFLETRTSKGVITHTMKNERAFRRMIRGYVSYNHGGSPIAYPKLEVEYVRVKMSQYQYDIYQGITDGSLLSSIGGLGKEVSNSFLIGSRMASNIVYPGGQMGMTGLEKMRQRDWSLDTIDRYAPKFSAIYDRIRNTRRPSMVYSGFKGPGGIAPLVLFLRAQGYKDVLEEGPGPNRYAVWSGDATPEDKARILSLINNKDNVDSSMCTVLLGSPSIKEGVSLKRMGAVHILEPYWNTSRMDQVIGRARRLCSHADLPKKSQVVQIYIYLAVHPKAKPFSVDERILQMAIDKQQINTQFSQAIKGAAVDCPLFHADNSYSGEPEIVCNDS